MPKSSKQQIEEDEHKVIDELSRNANKSINEIAKKCNFSRQKVWRIIKRLEKKNIIWGYVTLVDESKKGMKNYMILIKRTNQPLDQQILKNITGRKLGQNAKKIGITIESSFYVNGAYDWVICFSAENIKQAKKLCESLNRLYEGYIQDLQLIEIMFPIKRCGIVNPEVDKLAEYVDI